MATHPKTPLVLVLNNIRSLYNVGAIFRTADAANIEKIILIGTTPTPPRHEISKTALGGEKYIPWEYFKDIHEVISTYDQLGYKICALEQGDNSINPLTNRAEFPLLLIVGNEVTGVEKEVLERCDVLFELPMFGTVKSLNVATATGVALYQLLGNFCYYEVDRKITNTK